MTTALSRAQAARLRQDETRWLQRGRERLRERRPHPLPVPTGSTGPTGTVPTPSTVDEEEAR